VRTLGEAPPLLTGAVEWKIPEDLSIVSNSVNPYITRMFHALVKRETLKSCYKGFQVSGPKPARVLDRKVII
jgi:hypothetical protein